MTGDETSARRGKVMAVRTLVRRLRVIDARRSELEVDKKWKRGQQMWTEPG
jgi:hypothetical protein